MIIVLASAPEDVATFTNPVRPFQKPHVKIFPTLPKNQGAFPLVLVSNQHYFCVFYFKFEKSLPFISHFHFFLEGGVILL